MVRCLQITGWQKHRGHHTLSFSETQHSVDRLIILTVTLLISQPITVQPSLPLLRLFTHLLLSTSSRKHVKYINSSIFVLLTLKGAVCKVMVILTSWHHCTVLLMFFNDSVLSRLLFQCTDVVFRWVFSLVRHSSSPGGACELSMNPGRILSSRHPPSQSHNRPVRLISPLTP